MESRRKWRGVENFPPVKKAQWGQYSPPQPLLCARFLPSCLCNSTLNWVGEGDRCLACLWKLSRPSELSWLFVWTHARRKGALSRNDLVIVAVWFVAGRWSVGVKEPPPLHESTLLTLTHTLQLTSRLMFSQSMGPFIPPDYSINRRRTLEFMNLARADEFADRSVATGGCCRCCCTQSCCSGATILSPAVNELITDSHKSTQVQYNRARPFIIPVLTSSALLQ